MKKNILTAIIIFVMISSFAEFKIQASTIMTSNNITLSLSNKHLTNDQLTSLYIPHEPILITHDDNFTDYGFPGLGTKEEPYLIENYNITTPDQFALSISFTSKCFIVNNCYFSSYEEHGFGIYISEIASNTAIINNCTLSHSYTGIYLDYADFLLISNNTFLDIDICSLRINYCDHITIYKNNFSNSSYGAILDQSNFAVIDYNTFRIHSYYGLIVSISANAKITHNTFIENINFGFVLSSGIIHFLANTQIKYNNFTNNRYGLDVGYALNVSITNNIFNDNYKGLTLGSYLSDDYYTVKVLYNTFINDGLCTVDNIHDIRKFMIEENTVNGKKLGWFVDQQGLTLTDSTYGQIFLLNCSNSVIANQNLSYTISSIYCMYCINLIINNNVISNNNINGLYFYYSNNFITICNNIISYNNPDGLSIVGSNNTVVFNTFIENGFLNQAHISGQNNIIMFNYWSNWLEPDENEDGIVDEPYNLGSAKDIYPLTTPPNLLDLPPVITNVYSSPPSPTTDDTIVISATVIDNILIDTVTLFYRVNGKDWQNKLMSTSVFTVYNISIGTFAKNTNIEYYIEAVDFDNNKVQSIIYSFVVMKSTSANANFSTLLLPIASLLILIICRRKVKKIHKNQ